MSKIRNKQILFDSDLTFATQKKIINLENGADAADAVNKSQLDGVTNAFIAADTVVTNAFIAADTVVTNAFIAADVVVLDAAYAYADSLAQGLDVKASVRAATTGNITLSGTQTIDGVLLIASDRVLVKDQTTGSQNGIYIVRAGAWDRSSDADNSAEVTAGMFTFVAEGTLAADQGWVLSTNDTITLGTTALVFTQFSSAGIVTASGGLEKTGNNIALAATAAGDGLSLSGIDNSLSVNVAGGLEIASDNVQIASSVAGDGLAFGAGGVISVNVAGGLEIASDNVQIADSGVTTGKLADSAVTTLKINDGAVTTLKINELAVTTGKINELAVTTGKIDELAVTTAKINDSAVTTAKIVLLAVTTAKIDELAVTTAKIADSNVTNAKLDKANIPLSGFGAAGADVALGAYKLTGVADPIGAQDAATKAYVDLVASNVVTADNGLTEVANNVKLGGALTANTSITGAFELAVNTTAITNTASAAINNTAASMLVTLTDAYAEGITYAADYSADFVDRSLVDKAYVDNNTASATTANKIMVAEIATASGQKIAAGITYTPLLDSYVQVFINGMKVRVGDASNTADVYFAAAGSLATPKSITAIVATDVLVRGTGLGYNTDASDVVDYDYAI